ncbi:hypothetical protein D3C80_1683210 [compost metagenome]
MHENAKQGNQRLTLIAKDGIIRAGLRPVFLRAVRCVPAVGKLRRHIGNVAGNRRAITATEIALLVEQITRIGAVEHEFQRA